MEQGGHRLQMVMAMNYVRSESERIEIVNNGNPFVAYAPGDFAQLIAVSDRLMAARQQRHRQIIYI